MKKKLTITIASILSVIVIIGVGFAAWVITNPKVEDTADGSISVETVTDKSYSLTATDPAETISFGAPKTPDAEATKGWLVNEAKAENLTATLTLTLNYNNFADVGEITFKMEILGSVADKTFADLVNGGYIVNPTISYKGDAETYTDITATADKTVFTGLTVPIAAFKETTAPTGSAMGVATATIKITFGWGTKFGSENPYNHYNKQEYSTTLAKEANDNLTDLYNALNGVSYKVTVTGTTKAA